MKRSTTLAFLATFIFAWTGAAFAAGDTYKLSFNPKPGTTGEMIMDYTMNIGMEMMGQTMEMDQTMEMGASMKVLSNENDEIKTSMRYNYMAMKMDNAMTGTMEYDSRKENEGMFAAALDSTFKAMLNKDILMYQSHTGQILRSEGLDAALGSSNQGGMNMSNVMSMSTFPTEPVKIGDSWSNTIDDPSSPMKIDITMTLMKVADGKVYIDMTSDVSSNENFTAEGEEQVSMDISGTQNGSFVYDQSSMWLLEGFIKQDMQMEVEQMGMKIPMTIDGNMILTVE